MFLKLIVLVSVIYKVTESLPLAENEPFLESPRYQTYDELTNAFRKLESEHPEIAKLISVGRSVKNRELWTLQINKNVQNRTLLTPMFKFVGNMHGDETLGRQLVIYLAEYLILSYGKDDRITKLIDTTDLHLMPTMNPDGYANSQEPSCESLPKWVGRNNQNGQDLNRDFPDQFHSPRAGSIFAGRQPETIALMSWILSRPFVLSGNLHGGAVVASYPFDNSNSGLTHGRESKTPDNDVFKELALTYAQNHPVMKTGQENCGEEDENFPQGITNGAFWYELSGGMQDFNYVKSNCFEVTFEMSCCKYPPASSLATEWNNNKESMLKFMEATHWGVKGLVTNEKGDPVLDADIVVEGINHNVTTSNRGEYWRLLLPGKYKLYAAAFGHDSSEPVDVEVVKDKTTLQNFTLRAHPPPNAGEYQTVITSNNSLYDDYGFMIRDPQLFKHHHYHEMVEFLRFYNSTYPNITHLYSIGKSVKGRELYVLVLSNTPVKHVPGKPEFKYVANMHGNEVVGREMLLYLIKYMCERYGIDDRVTKLMNTTRIHLMPTMNPDGYEMSQEGDSSSGVGRNNADNFDLNRNFPDQYGINSLNRFLEPETQLMMRWITSEPFVLSANLHNGALVANYPFDDSPTSDIKNTENPSPDNELFKYLASTYSNAHRTMHNGEPCPMFPDERFKGGITNGAKWYDVTGGMQDWNYVVAGCMEITLEIGCYKYPYAKDLPKYWLDNKEALLAFMEQVHIGVHGFVTSTIGSKIPHAEIIVEGNQHTVKTASDGDYWRLLLPGKYNISFAARGYETYSTEIEVPKTGSVEFNAQLMKDDPEHWASAYDFGEEHNVFKPKYHSNSELYFLLSGLENSYPNFAEFHGGDDLVSMMIHWLKITNNVEQSDETKFHIAVIGNLFATQPIGREISINVARHLLKGLSYSDPTILSILSNTVVHVVPVIDKAFEKIWGEYDKEATGLLKPDKYTCNNITADFKQVGEQILDLNNRLTSNKDTVATTNAFKHMLLEEKFDLVLNIEGGRIGVVYPFTKDQVRKYEKLSALYSSNIKIPQQCPDAARGTDSIVTDFLYKEYYTPMLTVGVSCCEYPAVDNIPYIWRDVLDPIMAVLNATRTGVQGTVTNNKNAPLHNATIQIVGIDETFEVTKSQAHFKIMLPAGSYQLQISCHNYKTKSVPVVVIDLTLTDVKVVLERSQEYVVNGLVEDIDENGKTTITDNTIHEPFLGSVPSGIRGYVHDTQSYPVADAEVYIKEANVTVLTDSNGKYGVPLPLGPYTVIVNAYKYFKDVKLVVVSDVNVPKVAIFTLRKNHTIWGIPRLAFVTLTGFILAGLLGLGIVCFVMCKKRTFEYGLLSQNGFYEDFKDDIDDSKETEIFTRPIQHNLITRPYYDDDEDDENDFADVEGTYLSTSDDDDEFKLLTEKKDGLQ